MSQTIPTSTWDFRKNLGTMAYSPDYGFTGMTDNLEVAPTNINNTDKNANLGTMNTLTDYLDVGSKILGAGAGLANAYTGYKAYKQAQDKFKFEKALAQKNLANQAQLINRYIDASANVSAGLSSPTTATTGFTQDLRNRYLSDAETRKVSGTL